LRRDGGKEVFYSARFEGKLLRCQRRKAQSFTEVNSFAFLLDGLHFIPQNAQNVSVDKLLRRQR